MSNYIQRVWLRLLSPVAYVVNERIAKRPGFFGKIGKWFQIGPREYGMHPTNRAFVFLNRRYNFASAVLLHRYSVIKTLTHNGYHMIRPFKHLNFLGPLAVFFGLLRFVYHGSFTRGYEPDRLTYVSRRIGGRMGLPLSTLNHRTSAHFIEINYIYGAEMMKRYHRVHSKIIEERNRLSEDERKTRYAAPGYNYVAPKPVYLPPLSWD